MRKSLKAMAGERKRFRAVFMHYGTKPAYREPGQPTLLLQNMIAGHRPGR